MDVHHHPELPHGKKKHFKEYFLEFLMIFLAVTMGFIAENLREHMTDSSKENTYITGMIKNLADDTLALKEVIKTNRHQADGFDSLLHVSRDKVSEINVQDSLFALTTRYLYYADDFQNNDITLVQLRNAGGYSLIKNYAVLDSINVYELNINNMNGQFSYYISTLAKERDYANVLFDLNNWHNFRLHPTTTPVMISTDKEKVYTFFNQGQLVLIGLKGYDHMLEEHLKYSIRLINFLKKAYKVE